MTSSFSLNICNFITLRLTLTNYPLWREQALALAESQDLVGHLTNDDPAPLQYTTPNSNDTTKTKKFIPKFTKCFPYTWDTRRNKFDPKTLPCVFVGYSDIHKGYKCFHPSSKKFFMSQHVVFDESFFPYKTNRHHTTFSPTQHVVSIFDS